MKRRSKRGEENRIRVIQQSQQEDEIFHGRVDVPEGWQPIRAPEEMRQKEGVLKRNLHIQTAT